MEKSKEKYYFVSMNWQDFIKQLLSNDLRLSPLDAERETGISYQNFSRWMDGKIGKPQKNTIKRLEQKLNIRIDDSDPENITYTKNEQSTNKIQGNGTTIDNNVQLYPYPLIATVSAGAGTFDSRIYNEEFYMNFKPNGHRLFAVKVDGNSMDSTIVDGSIILVDTEAPLTNNCIVATMLTNGKQLIKRYKNINNDLIQLYPDNKEYESFVVDKKDIVSIYKVVQAVTIFL